MADIYIGNIKGPQGDTGATGAQGPQGDAATIEVGTVSTTAYGNTAQVINTGTSSEAVFDFVIPQGRPGEETTTMSSLTLDTVTAQSAEYPIPATGESGAVVFGKIIKFFNDAKTAINSKINISDIVNNLTSTATNKPLSAAQGKALNDAFTNIDSYTPMRTAHIITSASDLTKDKIRQLSTGVHIIQCTNTGSSGFPLSAAYGVLFIYGSETNYHHAIFTNDANTWKIPFTASANGDWQALRPTYIDVSVTVATAGTAMQISSASGYVVTWDKFINGYVVDSNNIRVLFHTYNNLIYAVFQTNTGANAPAGTYKVRCWYMP